MLVAAAEGEISVWRMVFYGIVVVGGFISLIFARSEREKTRKNFAALADALGFSIVQPRTRAISSESRRIVGKRGGRTVDVYATIRDQGRHIEKQSVVAMTVRNPRQLTLSIGRGRLSGLGAVFAGDRAVVSGDAEFDRSVQLRSNDPGYIAAALLPEVRQRIVLAWQQGTHGELAVRIGEIRYEEIGALEDARALPRVRALVDLMCDLAEIVEAYSEQRGG